MAGLKPCIKATTNLDDADVSAVLEAYDGYAASDMSEGQAARAAVDDVIESLQARKDRILEAAAKPEFADTEDVGEELRYNRRQRGVTVEDIENADNDTQKLLLATKTKLWERPNYQEMVDGGIQAPLAHLVKQIYDKIGNKPKYTGDEYIKAYAEGVVAVREAVSDFLNDRPAQLAMAKKIVEQVERRRKGSFAMMDLLPKEGEADPNQYLLDKVFPKNDQGARWGRNNKEGNTRALALGQVHKVIEIDERMWIKALKEVGEGWPKPKAAWQRSYQILPKSGAVEKGEGYRYDGGERITVYTIHVAGRYLGSRETEAEADAVIAKMKDWFLIKKKGGLVDTFDTEQAATDAVLELTKRKTKQQFKEPDQPVEKAKRTGADIREGRNVSTQELMDAVGFRGVNFGNWMKGKGAEGERQAHVNSAFDAMHDLANLLDVPVQSLSLNNMLGLAVGAQGRGGKRAAAAHFVPGLNEINITRGAGAGSLAHEWAHALDHYFAVQAGMAKSREPFLSTVRGRRLKGDIRPEIVEHFQSIYKAMTKIEKNYTEEEIDATRTSGLASAQKRLDRWLDYIEPKKKLERAEFNRLSKKLKKGEVGEYVQLGKSQNYVGETVNQLREAHKRLTGRYMSLDAARGINFAANDIDRFSDRDKYFENHPSTKEMTSEYMRGAMSLEGSGDPYWTTPWELFARAFEMYVYDKLQDQNQQNDYLVSSWKNMTVEPDTDNPFVLQLESEQKKRYPQGMERAQINEAFDALIEDIQTRETEKGVELYRRDGAEPGAFTRHDKGLAEAPARGMDVGKLRGMVSQIQREYPGLRDFDFMVFEKQDDALGPGSVDRYGINKGGFHTGSNEFHLYAENIRNTDDALSAIRHEAIGHYGLRRLLNTDQQYDTLLQRVYAARNGELADQYQWVKSAYPELVAANDTATIADEMLARAAEQGTKANILTRIYDWIARLLNQFGLARGPISHREVRSLIRLSEANLRKTLENRNLAAQDAENADMLQRRVYHGSAAQFEEFSTEFMSSGEGAQAYGWGIYLADSAQVGDFYRRAQTVGRNDFDTLAERALKKHGVNLKGQALNIFAKQGMDLRLNELTPVQAVKKARRGSPELQRIDQRDLARAMETFSNSINRGATYEVELADEAIDRMLDFDAVDWQQSQQVKDFAEQFDLPSEWMGKDVLLEARKKYGEQGASQAMSEAGIPGTKYWDEASRGGAEGTRNYVVFDPADLAIVSRDGVLFSRADLQGTKAVDEQGNPKLVYHGSTETDIAELDPDWAIETAGALFFTDNEDVAYTFTVPREYGEPQYYDEYGEEIEPGEVYRAYLNIQNPMTLEGADADKFIIDTTYQGQIVQQAKREGHDGLIVKDVREGIGETYPGDVYAVFSADQVVRTDDIAQEDSPQMMLFRRAADAPVDSALGMPQETWTEFFVRLAQNGFNRVGKLQKVIEQRGGEVTPESDVYRAEELSSGKIAYRLNQLDRNYMRPLLSSMDENGLKIEELDVYLIAKHARERNDYIASINEDMPDGGSGMTTAKADEILSELSSKHEALEEAAEIVYAVNSQNLDNLVEGGHLTQETADTWRERWNFYVPLKGKAGTEYRPGTGLGYSISGANIKNALGRGIDNLPESPTAHAFAQAESAIVRTEKTKVGQALVELIRANPEPDFWTIGQRTYKKFEDLYGEPFEGYEEAPEGLVENIDYHRVKNSQGQVVYRLDPNYRRRDDVFAVMVEGQELLINIKDRVLMEQLKRMNTTQLNAVVRGFGMLNRYLAMINTALNPEFVITNFERDFQTAMVNLGGEHSAEIAAKVARSIPGAIRGIWQSTFDTRGQSEWRRLYDEMQAEGGTIGFFGLEDIDTKVRNIQNKLVDRHGILGRTKKGVMTVRDVVLDANLSVENAARLAAYKVMRDEAVSNGMSRKDAKARAASIAKNLTVNFNRKGELAPVLNSAYLFYNASIQGSARILTALSNPRVRKIVGGIMATSFALALYNRSMGGDDDDDIPYWDKISDYTKQTNLIIMHPDGSGNFSKVRLPYGYNVFYYAGTAMHDLMFNSRKTVAGTTMNMLSATMNAFNPIQGADLLDTLAPTFLKPYEQDARNINFMAAPIKPEYPYDQYDRPESQKFFKSTNPTLVEMMQAINEATGGDETHSGLIDISPEIVKHYVSWLTGGAGLTVTRTLGTFTNLIKGDEIEMRNVPFVRTLGGKPGSHFDAQRYYDALKSVAAVEARLKLLRGTEEYSEYLGENREVHRLALHVTKYKNRIKRLREDRDRAYADDDKDLAAEKREAIRQEMMQFATEYDNAVESQE